VSGYGVCSGADIRLWAGFESKTTLGINELPVSFDSKFFHLLNMKLVRILEPEHQPPVA
jgi:hypothetical protein